MVRDMNECLSLLRRLARTHRGGLPLAAVKIAIRQSSGLTLEQSLLGYNKLFDLMSCEEVAEIFTITLSSDNVTYFCVPVQEEGRGWPAPVADGDASVSAHDCAPDPSGIPVPDFVRLATRRGMVLNMSSFMLALRLLMRDHPTGIPLARLKSSMKQSSGLWLRQSALGYKKLVNLLVSDPASSVCELRQVGRSWWCFPKSTLSPAEKEMVAW